MGTAFWLKNEKRLITCAHVVANLLNAPIELTGLLVVGGNGVKYRRALIDIIDHAHDLAVLRVLDENREFLNGEELNKESSLGLEIVNNYPVIATPVCYAGFPLGNTLLNELHAPTYAEGVIGIEKETSLIRKEIQITGAVTGGFSGSPIVLKDSSNNLVGVLSNSPSKEAGNANIFMAISWEHIKAIAELSQS